MKQEGLRKKSVSLWLVMYQHTSSKLKLDQKK